MPIYENETITREDLEKKRKYNVCAVCGARLNMYLDPDTGKVFLACWDWLRTKHEGIARENNELRELNILTRREQMENRFGKENTKTLARYQVSALITREAATEIVETLWKGAPPVDKTKAILLCATYNLNPLMNHLFMLPFKEEKTGEVNWAIVVGIEATRLMAHRKHNFTYLDLTPRRPTPDELEKILAEDINPDALYVITKIKDLDTGAEAYGLGAWKGSVYGEKKGNTPFNMASIHSERQALKRLYPAEMPAGIEVVDERFVDAIEGDYKVVNDKTGGIKETNSQKTAVADEPEPEEKPETLPDAVTTKSEPLEPEPSPIDLDWLKESLEKMQWTTAGKWLREKYGVTGQKVSQMVKQLTKEQAEDFYAEVQKRLEASGF